MPPKKSRKSYKEPDEDEFEDEIVDTKGTNGNTIQDEEDNEDEDEDDMDEDEYVVEKIFSHYIADDVRYLPTFSLVTFLRFCD